MVKLFLSAVVKLLPVVFSEITESLFERHVISEIIAVDPEKIGVSALKEIFEYLALRHSNKYITAELQIRKAGK